MVVNKKMIRSRENMINTFYRVSFNRVMFPNPFVIYVILQKMLSRSLAQSINGSSSHANSLLLHLQPTLSTSQPSLLIAATETSGSTLGSNKRLNRSRNTPPSNQGSLQKDVFSPLPILRPTSSINQLAPLPPSS
jgi:hypothetical protein